MGASASISIDEVGLPTLFRLAIINESDKYEAEFLDDRGFYFFNSIVLQEVDKGWDKLILNYFKNLKVIKSPSNEFIIINKFYDYPSRILSIQELSYDKAIYIWLDNGKRIMLTTLESSLESKTYDKICVILRSILEYDNYTKRLFGKVEIKDKDYNEKIYKILTFYQELKERTDYGYDTLPIEDIQEYYELDTLKQLSFIQKLFMGY